MEENKFVPPQPGAYQPQPVEPPQQKKKKNSNLSADEQIRRKRNHAFVLMAIAITSAVVFVIGIIIIATSFGDDSSDVPAADLSTDEQLEQDLNILGSAIISYNEANEPFNITPQDTAELYNEYLNSNFSDPRTGRSYTLVSNIPVVGEIQYVLGGSCNPDDSIAQSGNEDNFALRTYIESTETLFCLDRSEVVEIQEPDSN